MISVYR